MLTFRRLVGKQGRVSAFALVATLLLTLLAGCQAPPATPKPAAGGKRLAVMATFNVLGDMVQNVTGERADVLSLLPFGTAPHTDEPVSVDIQKVAGAEIVFYQA